MNRPFGRGTTPVRGRKLTIVANYLLTTWRVVKEFVANDWVTGFVTLVLGGLSLPVDGSVVIGPIQPDVFPGTVQRGSPNGFSNHWTSVGGNPSSKKTHEESYGIGRFTTFHQPTLPETNSSPLKMDGWNTTFLLGKPIFRGYVSFREGRFPCFPSSEVPSARIPLRNHHLGEIGRLRSL